MRPFGGLATYADALDVAMRLAEPVTGTETLELRSSHRRVLAADALASVDVPGTDRAAMDGFALLSSSVANRSDRRSAELRCIGTIAAGQESSLEITGATCIEVATGAPLPPGADAVVAVENTRRHGEMVQMSLPVVTGQHVSRRGEDLRQGQIIVATGTQLCTRHLGALAAGGNAAVDVWRQPRVLMAPTGDEVVPLGQPLRSGQVYESNTVALGALLQDNGATVEHAGIIGDRAEPLHQALLTPGCDLVVTIGGTSVGRRDLVADSVAAHGKILIHGVAIKPGKPLLLGRVADRAVVGLPGFPATCLTLAHVIVEPMIRRLAHYPPARHPQITARLSEQIRSSLGKVQLVTVALDGDLARPVFKFSSAVSSMSNADGWVQIAAETEIVEANTVVDVQLF